MTYSFSYLEPVCCSISSSNCCFLTCIQISQESSQVVWFSHLLKNFPQFIVMHTVKGFGIVNKAEIDVFLELPCSYPMPEARSGGQEDLTHTRGQGPWRGGATPRPRTGGCEGTGGPRGAIPHSKSGGAVVRRYPSSKVRSSGCALLDQP